ncbi:MAG: hypothetical protein WCP26_00380 [Actinomycetes bacterium]
MSEKPVASEGAAPQPSDELSEDELNDVIGGFGSSSHKIKGEA